MPTRLLLPFPAQRKPRSVALKRPTKDSPRCENLLNHRQWIDLNRDGSPGTYSKLPPTQCTHRGYTYKLNGLLTMTLCLCCLRRLMKTHNLSARTVRPTQKEKAHVHRSSQRSMQRSRLL